MMLSVNGLPNFDKIKSEVKTNRSSHANSNVFNINFYSAI
jgi:hypothetical protein